MSIFKELKSGWPKNAAMIGVTMSATNDATTAANASATTNPTAISTRLPLMMKALNSFSTRTSSWLTCDGLLVRRASTEDAHLGGAEAGVFLPSRHWLYPGATAQKPPQRPRSLSRSMPTSAARSVRSSSQSSRSGTRGCWAGRPASLAKFVVDAVLNVADNPVETLAMIVDLHVLPRHANLEVGLDVAPMLLRLPH